MLAAAAAMLAVTAGLGFLVVGQTRALEGNVAYTQDIVDANVRTLSQVQRELLRLRLLVETGQPPRDRIELQLALVDQRIQEGALPYQRQTLGSDELLQRSRELRQRWLDSVRPLAATALAKPARSAPADRAAASAALSELEQSYNTLVSDGEINRKVRAGLANAQTRDLLADARMLLFGLIGTAATFTALTAFSGFSFWRLHRQREAAVAELRAVNAELRTHAMVVRTTDNLVVITDPEGRVEWVNDALCQVTGYRAEEFVGRKPGDLLQGPDTDPATVAEMAEAVRSRRSFSVEVLNYTKAGEAYWVAVEAHPVFDDDGVPSHFIAIESVVTERRALEENLRTARDTAVSLAEEKAAFLATMSHEIRTPLNAVLGVTSLLAETELDPEQDEYVATAERSGKLLLALVNDILDFSALESGRVEFERQPVELRKLTDDVAGLFATDAEQRGLRLPVRIADDVPAWVATDCGRIRQVLVNLVGNGLKFTHHGEVAVEVSLAPTGSAAAPRIRFTVRDTGIGIPLDRQQRIFQPFTQVDPSTTRRYGGSGLGLSICALIADRLGGTLTLASAPGEGSAFVFEVPVAAASGPAPDAEDQRRAPIPADLRVLIAEDEPVNRMVALKLLRKLGVQADVAEDGVEAVELAGRQHYDIVLMDVHMPRLDGISATAELRRAGADGAARPRIVALTANALPGDRERFLLAGMDDYLSKPVTVEGLAGVLAGTRPPVDQAC